MVYGQIAVWPNGIFLLQWPVSSSYKTIMAPPALIPVEIKSLKSFFSFKGTMGKIRPPSSEILNCGAHSLPLPSSTVNYNVLRSKTLLLRPPLLVYFKMRAANLNTKCVVRPVGSSTPGFRRCKTAASNSVHLDTLTL